MMVSRLAVLVFLHDVGKLNAGFQLKVEPDSPLRRLGNVGHVGEGLRLLWPGAGGEARERAALADVRAALNLPSFGGWGPATGPLLLAALAHHGRPVDPSHGVRAAEIWRLQSGYHPTAAAQAFGTALREAYSEAFEDGPDLPDAPAFQHLFAGLVALADQIGSMEAFFPPGAQEGGRAGAAAQARAALAAIGLDVGRLRAGLRDPAPAAMFGWRPDAAPKPMQVALRDAPVDRRLLILEAETGSGKTEAAFLRFKTLFEAGVVDALYFAVPTRAAAAQLRDRINSASEALMGAEAILALPGYLRAGSASGRALPEWRVEWDDDPDQALRDSRWAAETPRRFLAATVAVGTVDQAMLAALQAKWAHFRAAALSRALLVIDEVHASDAYMARVIERLLRDHLAIGGHALLMSATLGAAARRRWLTGAAPPSAAEAAAADYPSVSWAEGGRERLSRLDHDGREKAVAVATAPEIGQPEAVAARVLGQARAGARVLVIRNTVSLAIETVRAIEALDPEAPLLTVDGVRAPHHGRFAAEDRLALDAAVEAALGKTSRDPVIVVGTQTLEQSLDIDADALVTDLCPVDVLLQRIGRLHRHARTRPPGFEPAGCLVLTPEALAPGQGLARWGLGPFDQGGGIYESIVALEATRRLMAAAGLWRIPADNRRLVEAATHPETLTALAAALGEDWERAHGDLEGYLSARRGQASLGLVRRDEPFDGRIELFADDERIRTRLGEERAIVSLPTGTVGPFGREVTRIALPAHFLRGFEDWDALESPDILLASDGLRLHVGRLTLGYTRYGLDLNR
jgi:CRISPR-associated endonuclease/helicase Cas3